jgi:hypothetical protein
MAFVGPEIIYSGTLNFPTTLYNANQFWGYTPKMAWHTLGLWTLLIVLAPEYLGAVEHANLDGQISSIQLSELFKCSNTLLQLGTPLAQLCMLIGKSRCTRMLASHMLLLGSVCPQCKLCLWSFQHDLHSSLVADKFHIWSALTEIFEPHQQSLNSYLGCSQCSGLHALG